LFEFYRMRNQSLLRCLVLLCSCGLLADESHQHLDRGEKLGTVSFFISCKPATHKPFERGIALMHSFWYDEAEKQFKALEDEDPSCAMAYWGEAMGLVLQLVSRPEEPDLKRGSELVQRAQATGAKTQRERDYINALALFYRDYLKVDYEERIKAYSGAMERVWQQYPEDQPAAVFYALSLLRWALDHDPLANPKKAIAILNRVFEENPDDPGAAHYVKATAYQAAAEKLRQRAKCPARTLEREPPIAEELTTQSKLIGIG
jgi:tetratricopeptide (TPR) repeat protein